VGGTKTTVMVEFTGPTSKAGTSRVNSFRPKGERETGSVSIDAILNLDC
jgi:hypothetical protein